MAIVVEQKSGSPKIEFATKDRMLFFNCTQELIDKAVENENRRKAYLGIGEWGEWED